jgi:hypothetical protein
MIFKNIFAEKFDENIGVFCSNYSCCCKKLIITLVFEKNAKFFAENWRKSQKVVIITSTPGQQGGGRERIIEKRVIGEQLFIHIILNFPKGEILRPITLAVTIVDCSISKTTK